MLLLPSIGRFTQPDPIEGGTANNYVYVLDPINGNDYSGLLGVTTSNGWRTQITVVYNYNMQPSPPILRPAVPSPIQSTFPAAKTQGTGSNKSSVGRSNPPLPVPPPAVLSQIGGGIAKAGSAAGGIAASSATWFGSGMKKGALEVWHNPQVQGSATGCAMGLASAAAWGLGTFIAGGPFATVAALAGGCALGGLGGYYDSILEGSGKPFRDLDAANGVYDTFRYFR